MTGTPSRIEYYARAKAVRFPAHKDLEEFNFDH
jgi:hypothetical protein